MIKIEILVQIWSNFYFQSIFKIILIVILSGIIGVQRDNSNKPAGFKTHTLLGISAVLVVICGESLSQKYDIDPFRIAAQFLSGIGFLGAGTILRDGFNVKGLTTASGLLTVSCIGLCVGAGFYVGAIIATVITYIILSHSFVFTDRFEPYEELELELGIKEEISEFMPKLEQILEEYDIEINQIEEINTKDLSKETNLIKIVCRYNNKIVSKSKIFTEMASIQNICNVNDVTN